MLSINLQEGRASAGASALLRANAQRAKHYGASTLPALCHHLEVVFHGIDLCIVGGPVHPGSPPFAPSTVTKTSPPRAVSTASGSHSSVSTSPDRSDSSRKPFPSAALLDDMVPSSVDISPALSSTQVCIYRFILLHTQVTLSNSFL